MNWTDAVYLLPEIILTLGACLLLIAPFMGAREVSRAPIASMLVLLVAVGLAVPLAAAVAPQHAMSPGLAAMFALDGFAIFFKLLLVASVALVAILSEPYLAEARYSAWEYYSLIAFALCGMLFMVSGTHLVSIYAGLELMSLASYILAGYYKNELKSSEAAMKYFVLGATSSGILVYGASLVFGVSGSLTLPGISAAIASSAGNNILFFGIVMLGAGLLFKIAAAPFHVWTPDVYEGAPTPVTAFLSTASKVAAVAILARIFYVAFGGLRVDWPHALAAVSALSMIIGNIAAVTQTNIKRLLAYSSIGHAGYILMGVIAYSEIGARGILVYSIVYVFATLGIWATILMLGKQQYAGELIEDFEGLHRRAPFWAFAMVVFLLSLGGIPPTAGFIGKYFLFAAAVQSDYAWLAIIAVLMSAVSMFYYLKVVVAMYLKEGSGAAVAPAGGLRFVAAVSLAITLVLGIIPSPLLRRIDRSIKPVVASVAAPELHAER